MTDDERDRLRLGWRRFLSICELERRKLEGRPLLELHDNRRGWPGDPPVQP